MSEKVTAGQRVKWVWFTRFINTPSIHLLFRKNKYSFSPRTIPKISSIGYSRSNRIFPRILQNNYFSTISTWERTVFPQQAHAPTLFIILCHFW